MRRATKFKFRQEGNKEEKNKIQSDIVGMNETIDFLHTLQKDWESVAMTPKQITGGHTLKRFKFK